MQPGDDLAGIGIDHLDQVTGGVFDVFAIDEMAGCGLGIHDFYASGGDIYTLEMIIHRAENAGFLRVC